MIGKLPLLRFPLSVQPPMGISQMTPETPSSHVIPSLHPFPSSREDFPIVFIKLNVPTKICFEAQYLVPQSHILFTRVPINSETKSMNYKLCSMPATEFPQNGNVKNNGLPCFILQLSLASPLKILILAPLPLSPPFTLFWVKGPLGPLSPSHLSKLPISPPPPCIHTCPPSSYICIHRE